MPHHQTPGTHGPADAELATLAAGAARNGWVEPDLRPFPWRHRD